jgi:Putative adhesin
MTVIASAERLRTEAVRSPERSSRARIAWIVAGLVLACAIVTAGAFSIVGSVAYQSLAVRHRVFTVPIVAVTVEVSSGDVAVEGGAGGDTVVTTSGVHGLTYPTDEERVIGRTLVIRSSCGTTIFNDRCRRNYVLHVQSGVAVTAESSQGNVNVYGTARAVSVHSDQGDVTITGGSGSLQASSEQGDVTVMRSAATSVSVHSDQGDVAIELVTSPNRVIAASDQGSVTVELPRGPNSYQVHASSSQGNVSDGVIVNPTSRRVVSASSAQGDVAVRYRSG